MGAAYAASGVVRLNLPDSGQEIASLAHLFGDPTRNIRLFDGFPEISG
jgi:hypothetical protein